jgi:hypothetical protein
MSCALLPSGIPLCLARPGTAPCLCLLPLSRPARTRREHLERAALNLECVTCSQRQCYLMAGARDDPLERRARDAHTLGGLCLRQTLKVGQAQRLPLLLEQRDAAQPI